MLTNATLARSFQMLGQLMELHGENAFKAKSYETAAFRIKRLENPLADMTPEERAGIPGVGQAIQAKIAELLERGSLSALDDLLAKTPPGVVEMLRIKGLGAKKVGTIWRELEVESLGELLYACRENRLALLKGFGEKTQAQVIAAIEFLQSQEGLHHYARLEPLAGQVRAALQAVCQRVEESGALRRRAIVLDRLEFVVQTEQTQSLLDVLAAGGWQQARDEAPAPAAGQRSSLHLRHTEGIELWLYPAAEADFDQVWFETSSSPQHLQALPPNTNTRAGDEAAIYASAGLPWIAPELREGRGEVQQAQRGQLPRLLELSDLRGAVHNHSTWSDGTASIESMARACMALGLEYLVISDHSRTAVYAGGLSIERLEAQAREIEKLNSQLAPFRILHSVESDILADGSLDYPDDVLARLDLVIASVHSGLKMDKQQATERLLKAIENPYTTVLGHPTGRLLLSRPGYPLDHEAIIGACARHGVVMELNANPWRLDLDWTWIPSALQAGVWISVNPDAHSVEGLKDMHYGVLAARKGGLSAEKTWNALPLSELCTWLEARRSAQPLRMSASPRS
jgi:DNA polymerase (family 10)